MILDLFNNSSQLHRLCRVKWYSNRLEIMWAWSQPIVKHYCSMYLEGLMKTIETHSETNLGPTAHKTVVLTTHTRFGGVPTTVLLGGMVKAAVVAS
jgi:hypothetical protein